MRAAVVGAPLPTAVQRDEAQLPFVTFPDSVRMQLVQANLLKGVWIVRSSFPPGVTVQTHRHTGDVYAFTLRGHWLYLESAAETNTPGSYLFEPAGSVHTLHVPGDNQLNAEVWFVIHGAILNLGANGEIEAEIDAASVLDGYRRLCLDQHGMNDPPVVV
jgi:quercetin dioxygenase-like cupin family protein